MLSLEGALQFFNAAYAQQDAFDFSIGADHDERGSCSRRVQWRWKWLRAVCSEASLRIAAEKRYLKSKWKAHMRFEKYKSQDRVVVDVHRRQSVHLDA